MHSLYKKTHIHSISMGFWVVKGQQYHFINKKTRSGNAQHIYNNIQATIVYCQNWDTQGNETGHLNLSTGTEPSKPVSMATYVSMVTYEYQMQLSKPFDLK